MRYLIVIFLVGCSSGYKPNGFTGGFSESRLDETVYRVSYQGNAYTSLEKASDFAMMRAAELTVRAGYDWFAVMDSSNQTSQTTYTTPKYYQTQGSAYVSGNNININTTTREYGGQQYVITKPGQSIIVKMFEDKPQNIFTFDPIYVYGQMYDKWNVGKK